MKNIPRVHGSSGPTDLGETVQPDINPITGITIPAGAQFRIQIWNTSPTATFLQARYVVIPNNGASPASNQMQYNKVFGTDFDASGHLFEKVLSAPQGQLIDFNLNYGNDDVIAAQTYVTVYLELAGGLILTKLVDGYLYPGHGLDYPKRHVEHPYPVPVNGLVRTFTPAVPGGNPYQVNVPDNRAWNVLLFGFEISTIGAVGASNMSINFKMDTVGGDALVFVGSVAAGIASMDIFLIVDVESFPILAFPLAPNAGTNFTQYIKIPRNLTLYAPIGSIEVLISDPAASVSQGSIITIEEFIKP